MTHTFKRLAAIWIATTMLAQGATAQGWSILDDENGYGRGGISCVQKGVEGEYVCLALRCVAGGPLEFAIIQEGGNIGQGEPVPLVLRVDGQTVPTLLFQPSSTTGQHRAEVAYDPVQHSFLLGAMTSGRMLEFAFFSDELGYSPMSLQGAKPAIDHAFDVCSANDAEPAPADGPLTAGEVRAQLIEERLWWGDGAVGTYYFPNGRYEGTLDGRANNGSYSIQPDGRLCWENGITSGCFVFYRDGGTLKLRRDDEISKAELGVVLIED
ncbi:MAG: hypothetical protein AAF641_11825 [Pseudomonadota bacterium]